MSVLLHIGFYRTGTTSIQYWLRDHEELLAEHGLRFPRGWLRLNNHFEMPLAVMRLDRMSNARLRGDEWRDAAWRADVLEQIADDLADHRDWRTILSAEDLSMLRYHDEAAPLRAVVGDAEVIAYHRKRSAALASMTAHYSKPGMAGLSDDPDAYNYLQRDTWRVDYNTLFALWRHHFSRVWIASYEEETVRDGSVVPSFLRHVGIPEWQIWQSGAERYRLNASVDQAIPRAEGNRLTTGERFGQGGNPSPAPNPPPGATQAPTGPPGPENGLPVAETPRSAP